jgi:hypothetical protein
MGGAVLLPTSVVASHLFVLYLFGSMAMPVEV